VLAARKATLEKQACTVVPCDCKAIKNGLCAHHMTLYAIRFPESYLVTFLNPPTEYKHLDDALHKLWSKYSSGNKMSKGGWAKMVGELSVVETPPQLRPLDVDLAYGVVKPWKSPTMGFVHMCMGLTHLAYKKYYKTEEFKSQQTAQALHHRVHSAETAMEVLDALGEEDSGPDLPPLVCLFEKIKLKI